MNRTNSGPDKIEALADIVGDVVGSSTPEGERLLAAIEELRRLRREIKKYSAYFLDTAHVVDAFRADDRTELGKALRELGKSFDAITDDRDSLENAVVPR